MLPRSSSVFTAAPLRRCAVAPLRRSAQTWPVGWSRETFERWFVDHWGTTEARHRCQAVAARHGVADMADDLHTEWYLSIRTTLDRLDERRAPLPDWIDDEEGATRYAARALDNDALDLGRVRGRSAHTFSDLGLPDGPAIELADVHVDVAASATMPGLQESLELLARELSDLLESGRGGCPGCTAVDAVRICMGVVERARSAAEVVGQAATLRGGTTEWDRRLYEVMMDVAPERMTRTGGNRLSDAARRFKSRCKICAEKLLVELIDGHGLGGELRGAVALAAGGRRNARAGGRCVCSPGRGCDGAS
jgi:hypothetical protein